MRVRVQLCLLYTDDCRDGQSEQSSPCESVYSCACCIQMTVVMDRVDRAVHASPCTVVLTAENCTCTNVP